MKFRRECPSVDAAFEATAECTLIGVENALQIMFEKFLNHVISHFNGRISNLYSSDHIDPLISEYALGHGPFKRLTEELLEKIDRTCHIEDSWITEFAISNDRDVDLLRRLLVANEIALKSMGRA